MNEQLKVGWGEADITPDGRIVKLMGQYYPRTADGIHSRLKTVALLFEQNQKYSLMISVDSACLLGDFDKQLQNAITEKYGSIEADKIMINAIHTHNAPYLGDGDEKDEDPAVITYPEYGKIVTEKILEAVQQALNSLQPSGVSNALSFASIGHCRRAVYTDGTAEMYGSTNRDDFVGMEGGEDSGVDLMFIFACSGQPTGAIVNVPCPSQVMEGTYKISSDYMGRLREMLKQRFGEGFMTLCQIAPSGCQSPRDLTRPGTAKFWQAAGVEIIADRLFTSIERVYDQLAENINYDIKLEHYTENLELPVRKASHEDYIHAKKRIQELENIQDVDSAYHDFCQETYANEKIPGRPGPYDSKLHHFVKIRNEEAVIKRFEEQEKKTILTMQLHVMRLGNIVFASNPFELYLDYGQRIRSRSLAEQTFMIQICNGYAGYLPSSRAEQLGGYGGLIINGLIGSAGGTILVDKTVQAINKLFNT